LTTRSCDQGSEGQQLLLRTLINKNVVSSAARAKILGCFTNAQEGGNEHHALLLGAQLLRPKTGFHSMAPRLNKLSSSASTIPNKHAL